MAIGYITAQIDWTGLGSPGTNTWHFRTTGSFAGGTEYQGLAGHVQDFYTAIAGLLANDVTVSWDGVFHGLGTDTGDTVATTGWEVDGSYGASTKAARAVSVVAQWKAATGGRSGRGRTFIGPLGSAAINDNGDLAPSFASQVAAAAQDLVDESTGFTNGAVVIYSPKTGLARDVVSGSASTVYGVLRSRRD